MIMRIISMLLLIQSNFSLNGSDFITRFGPTSAVYNEPLYFSSNKMIVKNKKNKAQKKYRDRIKKQLKKKQLLAR